MLYEVITFNYEKDLGNGPLSETEIETLLRGEVLKYGKDLADYKRVKKFTLREEEFPKTTVITSYSIHYTKLYERLPDLHISEGEKTE